MRFEAWRKKVADKYERHAAMKERAASEYRWTVRQCDGMASLPDRTM
jgi:hypothetical protein